MSILFCSVRMAYRRASKSRSSRSSSECKLSAVRIPVHGRRRLRGCMCVVGCCCLDIVAPVFAILELAARIVALALAGAADPNHSSWEITTNL